MARRHGRGHGPPGHRADREEARGARLARLHQQPDHAGPDRDLCQPEGHDQEPRRAGRLGEGPEHDQRHQAGASPRCRGSLLQRRLRRRLRQRLRLHRGRADAAAVARLCRGRPGQGADRAERRQGRPDRRAGRGHLPGVLDARDRGARHQPAGRHADAPGAERDHAFRRHRGRAGAHQPPGRRAVHLRGEPARPQPAHQRPLLPPQRCRHHHPRLRRPAAGAVPVQGRAGHRARHRHEDRRQPAGLRRGA